MNLIAIRLHPGQDLNQALNTLVVQQGIEAAAVVTCVGSLRKAVLRYANQPAGTPLEGPFEIVSLTGTYSRHGSHAHISISDGQGQTLGGHLMDGCLIYTTAEIVLAVVENTLFLRKLDTETGYDELVIQQISEV